VYNNDFHRSSCEEKGQDKNINLTSQAQPLSDRLTDTSPAGAKVRICKELNSRGNPLQRKKQTALSTVGNLEVFSSFAEILL
jgi:hypothetical protein